MVPWDEWLSEHVEQFFTSMGDQERIVVYRAIRLGWSLFPIGSRFVSPGNATGKWDIAILDYPFSGIKADDTVVWTHRDRVEIEVNNYHHDYFNFWEYGNVRFCKLCPNLFEGFVRANRLCLDNPGARDKAYRYEAVRVYLSQLGVYSEPPF